MKDNFTSDALAPTVQDLVLPEQLAQQAADAVRELLAEAAAANTTRSYASALRYWRVGRESLRTRPDLR